MARLFLLTAALVAAASAQGWQSSSSNMAPPPQSNDNYYGQPVQQQYVGGYGQGMGGYGGQSSGFQGGPPMQGYSQSQGYQGNQGFPGGQGGFGFADQQLPMPLPDPFGYDGHGPGHGHGGHGHGGHGFPPFLWNVTQQARQQFEEIMMNENLTKAQVDTQLDDWARAQGATVQQQYQEMKANRTKMETDAKQKLNEILRNTTNLIPQIDAIRSNTRITRKEERDQIQRLFADQSRAVQQSINTLEKAAMREAMPRPAGLGFNGYFPQPMGNQPMNGGFQNYRTF